MATKDFPAENAFAVPAVPGDFTVADFEAAQEALRAAAEMHVGGQESTDLSVSSYTVTPTRCLHRIKAASGTSAVVNTIYGNNFRAGQLLLLRGYDGHTITITSGATNLLADSRNCVLLGRNDFLLLERHGTYHTWREVSRNRAGGKTTLLTADGTFTVPSGVYAVTVTLVGGGGGGGGGGGKGSSTAQAKGADGGSGGSSTFNGTMLTASGGAGGYGGHGYYSPSSFATNGKGGKSASHPEQNFGAHGSEYLGGYGGSRRGGVLANDSVYGYGGHGGDGAAVSGGVAICGGGGSSGGQGRINIATFNAHPGDVAVG